MPLKQFTIDFQELANYKFLRNDVRFFIGQKERHLSKGIRLGKIFETGRGRVINQEYVQENEGEYPLYSSQTQSEGIFGYIDTYDFEGEYLTWTTDGANAGRVFHRNGKFNCTNVCGTAKIKKSNTFEINLKFLSYYLNTITKYYVSVASGNPKLMNNVFEEIKILRILKSTQDQVVAQIEPIEKKIKELRNQITPAQEVINKVFAREFGFDLEKFETLKKEKFFEVDFRNFNDYKLRVGFKSNNPSIKFLLKFLNNKSILLKDFLISNIISGDTPKYSEDGEHRVIKTINVNKDGFVEKFGDDKFVHKAEKILECKNILVTTHGEGRGKFGIYTFDDLATTDANCSIVKFNLNKINPLYLNYYFNSFFGEELFYYLESETKSVRYMKNDDLETMPILFSKKSQQKIVDEIKTELDKQEEMKQKIETERNKIDEIIEKAIR